MTSNTSQACLPRGATGLYPPKINICRGGCKPGFCLNSQCLHSGRRETVHYRPDADEQADMYRQHIEETIRQQKIIERASFLASERKLVGMPEFKDEQNMSLPGSGSERKVNDNISELSDRGLGFNLLKINKMRSTMRGPARAACMLDVPVICQTQDDYSQLSLFLRTSTMPGYGRNDSVSEYTDSYNMAAWSNRKDIDRQIHKFRRDWLSVWGENNFKEQRLRKAWQEKISGGGKL